MLATLLLSRGTPHLLAGDEVGNTQYGNNNAYCQDNKVSWIKWFQHPYDLTNYIRHLIELRHQITPLSSLKWWKEDSEDVIWLNQNAQSMSHEDWQQLPPSPLQLFLAQQWILMINPLRNSAVFLYLKDLGLACLIRLAGLFVTQHSLSIVKYNLTVSLFGEITFLIFRLLLKNYPIFPPELSNLIGVL